MSLSVLLNFLVPEQEPHLIIMFTYKVMQISLCDQPQKQKLEFAQKNKLCQCMHLINTHPQTGTVSFNSLAVDNSCS